MEETINTGYKR